MNLGIIESKTYDEISVGDTAKTEHVLTADDAMAFASISGFHSVLDSDELIDRAALAAPEQDYLDVLSDLVETY